MGLPNYIINLDELAEKILGYLDDTTITNKGETSILPLREGKGGWLFRADDTIFLHSITVELNNRHREYEFRDVVSITINKENRIECPINDLKNRERKLEFDFSVLLAKGNEILIQGDGIKSTHIKYSKIDDNEVREVQLVYKYEEDNIFSRVLYMRTPGTLVIPEVKKRGYKNKIEETIQVPSSNKKYIHYVECVKTPYVIYINCVDGEDNLIRRDKKTTDLDSINVSPPPIKGYTPISTAQEIDSTKTTAINFLYEEVEHELT